MDATEEAPEPEAEELDDRDGERSRKGEEYIVLRVRRMSVGLSASPALRNVAKLIPTPSCQPCRGSFLQCRRARAAESHSISPARSPGYTVHVGLAQGPNSDIRCA